jgi:small-conductance mechanosensitive channel
MPSSNFEILLDAIEKIILYLGRPLVQVQLIAIVVSMIIAWLLSGVIRVAINKWFITGIDATHAALDEDVDKPHLLFRDILEVCKGIAFPILGLVIVSIAQSNLATRGFLVGLLTSFIAFLWLYLSYRLVISIAYQLFARKTVRRYHYRLLGPLFTIFVIVQVMSTLVNLNQLSGVILIELYENPLTLGALLLATIGLYFWIDVVLGLEEMTHRGITRYTNVNSGVSEAVLTIGRYILVGAGLLFSLNTIGIDQTTIAAITGGLSVGVGFALQSVLGNFISGILLLFEQSLRPGDVISIDGEISRVKNLSIRATIVETIDNVEKIIPNETFLTSTVTTYSRSSDLIRLLIPLEVNEETATPQFVQEVLNVISQHEEVLSDPPAEVLMTGFGDTSVLYHVAVWIHDAMKSEDVTTDLNRMIWEMYPNHGFGNSTPQRNLHILHIPWRTESDGNENSEIGDAIINGN